MRPSELKPFIEGSPAANANVICCICGTKTSWNRAAKEGWIADLDGEPYNAYYCLGCPGKIKSAAIKGDTIHITHIKRSYTIYTGKRHHNVIAKMVESGCSREEIARSEQGFVNYRGEFLNRKQALEIAVFHNQVDMADKREIRPNFFPKICIDSILPI